MSKESYFPTSSPKGRGGDTSRSSLQQSSLELEGDHGNDDFDLLNGHLGLGHAPNVEGIRAIHAHSIDEGEDPHGISSP